MTEQQHPEKYIYKLFQEGCNLKSNLKNCTILLQAQSPKDREKSFYESIGITNYRTVKNTDPRYDQIQVIQ